MQSTFFYSFVPPNWLLSVLNGYWEDLFKSAVRVGGYFTTGYREYVMVCGTVDWFWGLVCGGGGGALSGLKNTIIPQLGYGQNLRLGSFLTH